MLEAIRQFIYAYYIHHITHDTGYNILGYNGKQVIEGIIVKYYTGSALMMFPLKLGILIPVLKLFCKQKLKLSFSKKGCV